MKVATLWINPALNRFEAVTVLRRGHGVLEGWTSVRRASGHAVWVSTDTLSF